MNTGYFAARLKEPSTWRGICAALTAVGVALEPDQIEAIIAAGLAVIGVLGAFTSDVTPEPPQPEVTPRPPLPLPEVTPRPQQRGDIDE